MDPRSCVLSPVRPRWIQPDVDYAPGLEVGDVVTVVATCRVVRKVSQSAGAPTIVKVQVDVDDPDSVTEWNLWIDGSWVTTPENPRTLVLLDVEDDPVLGKVPSDRPLVTVEKQTATS